MTITNYPRFGVRAFQGKKTTNSKLSERNKCGVVVEQMTNMSIT